MLLYDFQKLKDAAVDFYTLTNISIVLYDDQFRNIYSYPPRLIPFCKELRKSPSIMQKCLECDKKALIYCQQKKTSLFYRCHFGLSEAISPIMEGDTPIGYLMFGGVVSETDRPAIEENILNLSGVTLLNVSDLLLELSKMPNVNRDKLTAALNIMEMCAHYLASKNIVHPQHTFLHMEIDRYIKENISSRELSLNDICHRFSISRSTLYTVSTQGFGMGISDYIRLCRIEHAKKLLLKNSMSIAEISAACGFSTPSRFTKTFKQMVGVLPKNYLAEKNT